ncbi:MAG: ribose-phosphate pyrophosphokinase, partial [Ruthenibacterium sp.]
VERIQNSALQEVVLLDTILLPEEKRIDKIKILSVAPMLAEAVARIYSDKPVSTLFV